MSQNIFSVEGLISWLELQPGETEYNYMDVRGDCLLGRYARSQSWRTRIFQRFNWGRLNFPSSSAERKHPGLRTFNSIAVGKPWTYSAALQRARAMVAS